MNIIELVYIYLMNIIVIQQIDINKIQCKKYKPR